jgi:glycosyltransferase involved in cell wall biosynthesis
MPELRVGVDITPLLTRRQSGVGVYVREIIPRIAAQASVVGFSISYAGSRIWPSWIPESVECPSRLRRKFPAALALRLWQMAPIPTAEMWTGSVNVVHGTNFILPPSRRARGIVTVHDLSFMHFPSAGAARLFSLLVKAGKRGAWFHVPTSAVAEELKDLLRLEDAAVHVIPHGVPILLDPSPEADAKARILTHGRPYILALGDVIPRKELPFLVECFDRIAHEHDDIRLVIAGNRVDEIEFDKLLRTKNDTAWPQRITVSDWIDEDVKSALIRGAIALAYPSSYEGFGLPILEAQSVGVPAVICNTAGMTSVAGRGALVTPTGDSDGYTKSLSNIIGDSALRQSLVEAGIENARLFSWERTVQQLVELYLLAGTN